ncbi:alpha/beta fold hydrolase [Actinoplanes sp. NPDC051470]|uniref:alpha/beta fold hydrolase n=1 Tax=Actinoplanes sp. NPDC051470 TaxID=3157224 RepID=UPI0034136D5A
MTAQTHRLDVDGVQVGVREYGEPGAGPSVVFLPAMGVPLRYYEPLFEAWPRHVIGVEWRGQPESRVADLRRARFGYSDLLRVDLPAVVALAADRGAPQVVLVGHSLGGQIALLAAASGTVRPAAVVTVATGTSSPTHLPLVLRWQRRLGVSVVRTITWAAGHWPGDRFRFAGRQPRTLIRDWAYEARHGRYRFAGDPTDYEAALAGSRVPALLIDLAGDRMIPAGAVDHLAARVGGPVERASLSQRAGFDHFSWARRTPRVVIDRIETWLGAPAGPR